MQFCHPHFILNLYDFFISMKHKRNHSEECSSGSFSYYESEWRLGLLSTKNKKNDHKSGSCDYIPSLLKSDDNSVWENLTSIVHFILFYGKEHLEYSSKFLLLRFTVEIKSHKFGMTWAWVNSYKMFILGWIIPLKVKRRLGSVLYIELVSTFKS